jgi:ABC-type nickel/cobalt efflux system permease component RcnA
MTLLLFLLLALGIAVNACATAVLVRSPRYDLWQKWMQFGIIWLLPAVGAFLVWSMARDTGSRPVATSHGNDEGIDYGDLRPENHSSGWASHGDGDGGSAGSGD